MNEEIKDKIAKPKVKSEVWEFFKFSVIAVAIVIPIRFWIAQPFIVHGNSMTPNFHNGDYLIIDEITYRFREPKRGEVVVFRYPKNTSQFFIKRIEGLPGETINGATLAENEYYVLGDNLLASSDSRFWGPLKSNLIVGRAVLRLWPIADLGLLN
jgi:signal peptidase I